MSQSIMNGRRFFAAYSLVLLLLVFVFQSHAAVFVIRAKRHCGARGTCNTDPPHHHHHRAIVNQLNDYNGINSPYFPNTSPFVLYNGGVSNAGFPYNYNFNPWAYGMTTLG